ncbi:MAG TPA: YbhB/YbcL family Raf kinase inhibitor-like protein [Casimicrobiaceae bacterium]|nr:YbhB/YbcL family Raf kinase inhibitor-like protein [Casimicrobiaceae bacterium]
MRLATTAFADGGWIPAEFAFGRIDPASHVALSQNRNPDFAWSEVPDATRSFALLCVDADVPSQGDDVNQEGREVPAALARVDFFHWVLVDIAAQRRSIARGEFSDGVTARGKPGPAAPGGTRQGINDYTGWFAGDAAMAGDYYGYDGPCPPWNDARMHHYRFTLYALDVASLPLDGAFAGADARRAIAGHVLAEAAVTGRYTLNPRLR